MFVGFIQIISETAAFLQLFIIIIIIIIIIIYLDVHRLMCSPQAQRLTGSNPGEVDGIFRIYLSWTQTAREGI